MSLFIHYIYIKHSNFPFWWSLIHFIWFANMYFTFIHFEWHLIVVIVVHGLHMVNKIDVKWGPFALYIIFVNDQPYMKDYVRCGSLVTQEGGKLSTDDYQVMWSPLEADLSWRSWHQWVWLCWQKSSCDDKGIHTTSCVASHQSCDRDHIEAWPSAVILRWLRGLPAWIGDIYDMLPTQHSQDWRMNARRDTHL